MFGAGIAGAAVAAKIPFAVNTTPTIGGINSATFSFWRNQGTGAITLDHLRAAMRETYNKCSIDGGELPETILFADEAMVKCYASLLEP